jgi:hypothetical protein
MKQPKWKWDATVDDIKRAELLAHKMLGPVGRLGQVIGAEVLKLLIENRKLRGRVRELQRSASKSEAREVQNTRLRRLLREAREKVRATSAEAKDARAELRRHMFDPNCNASGEA